TQRAYYRALHELRTLQTNRALRAAKLDEETAAEVPAITDINELTKQTQSEITAEALELAIYMLDLEAKTYMREARSQRSQRDAAPPAPESITRAQSPSPAA